MIIKPRDDIRPAVTGIEKLLARKSRPKKETAELQAELRRLLSGAACVQEAAGQIDLHLKDSRNWAVIHGLRLEHHGRIAEIDHLLINRYFDIFVVESKEFGAQMRIGEAGEFEVRGRWGWKRIPSPIERNKGHIIAVNNLMRRHKLTPMRLGVPMRPVCRNWILVPAEVQIPSRCMDQAMIVKVDAFGERLSEYMHGTAVVQDVASQARVFSIQTITDFAQRLIGFHQPAALAFAPRAAGRRRANGCDEGQGEASRAA